MPELANMTHFSLQKSIGHARQLCGRRWVLFCKCPKTWLAKLRISRVKYPISRLGLGLHSEGGKKLTTRNLRLKTGLLTYVVLNVFSQVFWEG